MPKRVTGRQAIQGIAEQPGAFTLATVIETQALSRDKNGVILTTSPIVTVNYHGIGGLGRVELPSGIDPAKVSVNDDLLVIQQNGRALAVQHYPASNRTAAGAGGLGHTLGLDKYSSDITVVGTIVGNQLELSWNAVPGAEYYQIWTSPTGDPSIDDNTYVANSPTTSWVSKLDGMYFDDGMWYAVMAQQTNGQAGTLSPWVQPVFGGNYAHGLLSTNQTTSIPGSMVVTLGGSITRKAFTSVDSPTTFNVDIADPIGIHPSAWANGNILQFTDTAGHKLWCTIASSTDKTTYWRYAVTKSSPGAGTNYTIPTGSSVVNWGSSGQGAFIVSADGTFGAGTLWQIVTHSGTPWVSFTVQVYADSTGKVFAGGGADILDVNGLSITVGTTAPHKIKFVSGATTISELYEFYNSPTQSILTLSDNVGNTLASGGVLLVAEDSAGHGVVFGITQDASGGYLNAYNTSGTFIGATLGSLAVPKSLLDVLGSLGLGIVSKSANYPLTRNDSTVLVSATATITLPDATTCAGRIHTVFLTNAATVVTVVDAMTANINGAASDVLTVQYSAHTYQSNGTQWYILSKA